jgi:hypothetical protein
MEKADTHKHRERDDPMDKIRSLKAHSILQSFNTMDLQEKRALVPELLKMARIVNGYPLDCVSANFVQWICSGEKKIWKEEEVENLWEMWNFLYRKVSGGAIYFVEKWTIGRKLIVEVWDVNNDSGYDYDNDEFYDNRSDDYAITTRESFFNVILKELIPEQLVIGVGDSEFNFIPKGQFSFESFQKKLKTLNADFSMDYVPDPRFK